MSPRDADGTVVGSVDGYRDMVAIPPRPGRKRKCLCGQTETHIGRGDGVALMGGCVWCVRRWVKRGYDRPDVGAV